MGIRNFGMGIMLAKRLYIRAGLFFVILIMCLCTLGMQAGFAQTPPATEATVIEPRAIEQSIKTEMVTISENSSLTSEEQEAILSVYRAALGRLSDGDGDKAQAERFVSAREDTPKQLADVGTELEGVLADLNDLNRDVFKEIDDQNLELGDLEQMLVSESSSLGVLRGELAQFQSERAVLEQFSSEEPVVRADNDQKISELSDQIRLQKLEALVGADKAGYALAQASLYARGQSNTVLDARKAGALAATGLLADRIMLKTAQIRQKVEMVNALQIKTGSARTMVAEQKHTVAMQALDDVVNKHALIAHYAQENVELSERLLEIAQTKEDLPTSEAKLNRQIDQVKFDRIIADQILGTKKTSRSYGLHLRQLRQKQPNIPRIKSEIKTRDIELQDVLFKKIIYQESLALFNGSPLDVNVEMANFVTLSDITASPVLEGDDVAQLRDLHDGRRDILNALAYYSELKTRKLEEVNALQNKLLDDTLSLCVLLDGRLLWLPSTEAVGFSWPGKVFSGLQNALRLTNLGAVANGFWQGFQKNFFFVFLAGIILGLGHVLRERFAPLLSGMSGRVGRVQKDGYSLTPIAVLDGIVRAVPWVLIPLLMAAIFSSSAVDASLATPLVKTCFILSGLVFVFVTLREWCQKGALFELHFRVDQELRLRLIQHLPWLLLTQAISVVLIGLTRYNFDYDSGASALGILGFLIGSISIAVFTVKIAWARTRSFKNSSRDSDGIYLRNEKWFFLIAIVVPSITAILSVLGYYETARLLLSRFFLSFCVLMVSYVLHGLFRRSMVIAQRRLALEQARSRRDQAVKARMEKVAAEERGEVPVPSVDYDRIDLETINRQSSQLVNVTVFLITVGILWALWSDVLPALSVLNDIEAWGGHVVVDAAGNTVYDEDGVRAARDFISVWNVMQALGVGFITWLAARNLPGFLEVFVLKRMNLEQSSRYAIVTVLGYIIFIIGALAAFDKIGTQWSQLQWIVAALSVGIGLGLQAIFANFVSGLIILFERPVRIGDYITIGDISGTVSRIQIRATTLMDLDNKETLIPNQELVSQRVTNWTLSNSVTRLIVPVGIAYGSDTERAQNIMLETVKSNPNVLASPESTVLFLGFGDSTLDFEIRVFLRDFVQRYIVSHEIHMAIDAALRKADIEIAFPQRDLHIKNVQDLVSKPTS